MEPVRNLYRIRSALSAALRVCAGAITDNDLDAWMLAQPGGEYLGSPVVQWFDWSVGFEVDKQGAVTALFPSQCQVVDSQNPRTS
jgi:hypothetical protein